MEIIKIHGSVIRPARVNGSPDVFTSPHFSLVKAEWEPDVTKSHCDLCSIKFSQLKRRHHCRMCGQLRCAKCCNDKSVTFTYYTYCAVCVHIQSHGLKHWEINPTVLPLPHLDLEEPERVCDSCRSVVELVLKSRAHSSSKLIEAANGLSIFASNPEHIKKLLELGGLQTLVALSLTENPAVLKNVVSGLHALATHPGLHNLLAETGGIKALCKILSTTSGLDNQISADGIGALMIFCKTNSFKTKVIDDGGLSPVLSLCWSSDEAVCLLAISTLGLIAENPATHPAILDNQQNSVPLLLKLCKSEDEQIQEVALKTLAFLSTGTPDHRRKILQEDFTNGRHVLCALSGSPNNPQILSNAACLVANLAACEENQSALHDYLDCVSSKLNTPDNSTELTCHLTRALANLAQHKQNASFLMNAIPSIVQNSLKTSNEEIKGHSMRFLLSMLACEPGRVSTLLVQDGCQQFLTTLGKTKKLIDAAQASIAKDSPDTVKPL